MTLTRNNSYTGDTVINVGTLSIQNAYLADLSDVRMTSGSSFNLDFSGTDTVNSLFIDGVAQATGTWGANGSGATNQSSLITGSGFLEVSQIPEPSSLTLLSLSGLLVFRRRRPCE